MTGLDYTRSFILQAEDPETGCPWLEARFEVSEIEALRAILGGETSNDPDLDCRYFLDDDQLSEISERFGVALEAGDRWVSVDRWHKIRCVPYLVHTGFELSLMLEERKPLAVFSYYYPSHWFDETAARFAPFVADGRIIHHSVDRPFPPDRAFGGFEGARAVFFALPSEGWRIEAMVLLLIAGHAFGWRDAFERLEGMLLGYEAWQADWWAAHRHEL